MVRDHRQEEVKIQGFISIRKANQGSQALNKLQSVLHFKTKQLQNSKTVYPKFHCEFNLLQIVRIKEHGFLK